jgi:GNAT superfamily N-acetyltransferase
MVRRLYLLDKFNQTVKYTDADNIYPDISTDANTYNEALKILPLFLSDQCFPGEGNISDYTFYIAENNNILAVVSYIIPALPDTQISLWSVCTNKLFRGQGIISRLISRSLNALLQNFKNIRTCILYIETSNKYNETEIEYKTNIQLRIRLYKKIGFVLNGVSDGATSLQMIKNLTSINNIFKIYLEYPTSLTHINKGETNIFLFSDETGLNITCPPAQMNNYIFRSNFINFLNQELHINGTENIDFFLETAVLGSEKTQISQIQNLNPDSFISQIYKDFQACFTKRKRSCRKGNYFTSHYMDVKYIQEPLVELINSLSELFIACTKCRNGSNSIINDMIKKWNNYVVKNYLALKHIRYMAMKNPRSHYNSSYASMINGKRAFKFDNTDTTEEQQAYHRYIGPKEQDIIDYIADNTRDVLLETGIHAFGLFTFEDVLTNTFISKQLEGYTYKDEYIIKIKELYDMLQLYFIETIDEIQALHNSLIYIHQMLTKIKTEPINNNTYELICSTIPQNFTKINEMSYKYINQISQDEVKEKNEVKENDIEEKERLWKPLKNIFILGILLTDVYTVSRMLKPSEQKGGELSRFKNIIIYANRIHTENIKNILIDRFDFTSIGTIQSYQNNLAVQGHCLDITNLSRPLFSRN